MENTPSGGLLCLARQEAEAEELLEKIPKEHRGVLFQRVCKEFHPQEDTRRLERSFAEVWAERNSIAYGPSILHLILSAEESDPRREYVPRNEREWQVAYLVAATIVQWLPTSGGCHFLTEAFRRGDGTFSYTLPQVDE
ncbi:MAG: hypothetical protein Q8Q36_01675 [bacterium]|nr:hypothetical protein [bacterium]